MRQVTRALVGSAPSAAACCGTDVVIEVRNGRIDDLYWGENKALLFKPGESIKVWGEVLKELNRRYNRQAGMPRELPAWL